MSDPVPAITENDAVGAVATIFADIRAVLGVDVVNLIWRHLATIQGALPWAWGTLRPLYADGTIGTEAAALRDDLDLPQLPKVPPEVLAAAGLLDNDLAAIRSVLAAYDRTNAMALIALSALLSRLHDQGLTADTISVRGRALPRQLQAPIALPPLLRLDDMAASTAGLVLMLNRLGTRREAPILASMYCHLAHWPPYLALTWTVIAPVHSDGRLDRAVADAVAKARMRAEGIAVRLRLQSGSELAPAASTAVREALDAFTGDVIAKMVVICAVMRGVSGQGA